MSGVGSASGGFEVTTGIVGKQKKAYWANSTVLLTGRQRRLSMVVPSSSLGVGEWARVDNQAC